MHLRALLGVALALACALTLLGLQAFLAEAGAHRIYVTNRAADSVSVIDSRTNAPVGAPIDLRGEADPVAIAITPDGTRAYVANNDSADVSVIDTRTNQILGPRISASLSPFDIAVTPDGSAVYVVNNIDDRNGFGVTAIDTRSNLVSASIPISDIPRKVVVHPHLSLAYVLMSRDITVIDTRTNQIAGGIEMPPGTAGIAITPDGKTLYVGLPGTVLAIDTRTNQAVGLPIPVGNGTESLAVSPDGKAVYVSNQESDSVSVIDTGKNQVTTIPVGDRPKGIVVSPDGKTVYVAIQDMDTVSVIDTRTNRVVGAPIPVGDEPEGLAIIPNQPPGASFLHQVARPGVPTAFDASASQDADGAIASFTWLFEGSPAFAAGAMVQRTFPRPGTYDVTLTPTDDEGCSTTQIFTGQTAHCNGSAAATKTVAVKVAYPGVRVRCPAKTTARRCKFALQVVTKARKGKPKTRVAKASAKRGKAAIVSLKPKARYAKQLARAKKVLVKVTLKTGDSRQTTYRKLKIVR